ncbi:hypothetical protein PDESU_04753 [Pontiella desulfatans]|uniref:Lipopolysaccharide assembly protein B n=1 Tax=Pontiella desulfatans TaxID=2750659 RepID=A0A6C2U8K9_PONDE|nr:tetratricopeptide repeat protein [Pontiella desulfatans]VGO16163.1 hypothetical protein PDESU_04753 [Pontiella desulfatans]
MKNKCPICSKGKPRRECRLQENTPICSRCCAEIRGTHCEGCPHYAEVLRHQAERWNAGTLPDGHFIAEINPEVQDAVDSAFQLQQNGDLNGAMEAMEQLASEHPRNHDVCYGMGTLHAMNNNPAETVEWLKKAVEILPYFPEAYFNMAEAYRKLYSIGDMVRAHRKVVEYGDPGEEYYRSAKESLEHTAQVIQENNGIGLNAYLESEAAFNKAFALMEEEQQWEKALAGFQAAAALHDLNAPTHGNMGLCLAYLGRKAEALAKFDRALEIDPAYEPAMFNRLSAEAMDEGHPLEVAGFKTIHFSKEQVEKKKGEANA